MSTFIGHRTQLLWRQGSEYKDRLGRNSVFKNDSESDFMSQSEIQEPKGYWMLLKNYCSLLCIILGGDVGHPYL